MALRLTDRWIWDFWFAEDGPDIHMYFLQADRALGDPDLRHWNVSIGHAVSRDMQAWEERGTILAPDDWDGRGPEPADAHTTWTGSVIQHDGVWYMFYTGTKPSERGLIQRVCLATSPDLHHWTRHDPHVVAEADPTWYEELDLDQWHDQAWRDPHVVRDPETGLFHMFLTARANDGPSKGRGVIGHATSPDLIRWTVGPPISAPGYYGELEVPQVMAIDGRYYCLFSTRDVMVNPAYAARMATAPVTGIHYLVADAIDGPYRLVDDRFMLGDPIGAHYSGKLVRRPDRRLFLIAFEHHDPAGRFVGEVTDPMPVSVLPDGRLRVET